MGSLGKLIITRYVQIQSYRELTHLVNLSSCVISTSNFRTSNCGSKSAFIRIVTRYIYIKLGCI